MGLVWVRVQLPLTGSQTPSGRPTRMIGGDACELNAEIRLWLRYASLRYSDGAGVPHHSRGSLPAGLEMGLCGLLRIEWRYVLTKAKDWKG